MKGFVFLGTLATNLMAYFWYRVFNALFISFSMSKILTLYLRWLPFYRLLFSSDLPLIHAHDLPTSQKWMLRSVIVGGYMVFVPWFSGWSARLANCRWPGLLALTFSRNGFMLLIGGRLREWHICGRAKYSCSWSPATTLLQDILVRGILLPGICSSRLVSSKYIPQTLNSAFQFVMMKFLSFLIK